MYESCSNRNLFGIVTGRTWNFVSDTYRFAGNAHVLTKGRKEGRKGARNERMYEVEGEGVEKGALP